MSSVDIDGVSYVVAAGRHLLDNITVSFPAGEVSCLSGPSGAGKTTLLSVAGGLLPPTSGTATYAGRPTWLGTGDPRPEVTFVLQVYGLVPVLSALENVSVALRARGSPLRSRTSVPPRPSTVFTSSTWPNARSRSSRAVSVNGSPWPGRGAARGGAAGRRADQ